ncbi:MAG: PDZ domain-containing protein [Pseudomonadota bacterium]
MKWMIPPLLLIFSGPALAQSDNSRADREQLRELRQQLADTQRQLNQMNRRLADMDSDRRVARVPRRSNRSPLFVYQEERPMLGVILGGSDDKKGVKLTGVTPDAPAEKAGLKAGDLLVGINDVSLRGRDPLETLLDELEDLEEGDRFKVTYERRGREYTADLEAEMVKPSYAFNVGNTNLFGDGQFRFETGPGNFQLDMERFQEWAEEQRERALKFNDRRFWSGQKGGGGPVLWNFGLSWSALQLAELNPSLARYFGVTEGVLVVDSQLDDSTLEGGDVIMSIGGADVTTPQEAMNILSQLDAGESVDVSLVRDGSRRDVALAAPEPRSTDFSFGFYSDD